MTVRIVTDSTADIPPALVEEMQITVVPLFVIFGEEVFRDGVDLTAEEFFRRLRSSTALPRTSQPPPAAFVQVYEDLVNPDGILSIHLSSRFSGTFDTARAAARVLEGRCRAEVVDSGSVSMGVGLAVLAAARVAKAGGTIDECLAAARSIVEREEVLVTVETLEYLRRGGRIGRAQAFLGGLLNLQPILTIREGETYPLARTRTRMKALDRIIELAAERGVEQAAVMDATTPEDADYLASALRERFPAAAIFQGRIGPVVGVHGGPGIVGMAVVRPEGARD